MTSAAAGWANLNLLLSTLPAPEVSGAADRIVRVGQDRRLALDAGAAGSTCARPAAVRGTE
jgi:hypothetical protein